MTEPELSLVLPMYNVEQFVEECLRSIYCQPEADRVEVILVDDGSPDRSSAVAQRFLEAQPLQNWRIIRQENRGLGGARNTGLAHARAPYVWFIDTDDLLAPASLAEILPQLNSKPDALALVGANMPALKPRFEYNEQENRGSEIIDEFTQVCAPFYVWSKDMLSSHGIEFQEHLLHEDNEFTPRALHFCRKVRMLNEVCYHVRQNPQSITRTFNPRRAFDLLRVCQSLEEFANFNISNREELHRFHAMTANRLCGALSNASKLNEEDRKKFIHELKSPKGKQTLRGMLRAYNHRSLVVLLAIVAPSWAIDIYKIKR